jgi:phosphatidylinositol 3,5-bisphosphate 5-phosphatase
LTSDCIEQPFVRSLHNAVLTRADSSLHARLLTRAIPSHGAEVADRNDNRPSSRIGLATEQSVQATRSFTRNITMASVRRATAGEPLETAAEAVFDGPSSSSGRQPRAKRSLEDSDSSEDEKHAAEQEADSIHLRRPRRSTTFSKTYSPDEDAAVLRKLDFKLTMFLSALYLLSFLDRSNIGNARIAGLEDSLSLSSGQFDWLLTAFYLTYIGFEWMILLYKILPPHAYIACCVMGWGLIASLQALTTSFPQLLVLRGMLGITEAAFGPGVPFYMTYFYRRRELGYRVGLQISAAPLATSFASSLAWVIVKLNRIAGEPVDSWRMLFLVEGFPSVLVGVLAWYWVPDSPATARWLTPRERKVAALRVREEADDSSSGAEVGGSTKGMAQSRWAAFAQDIKTTVRDPKCYLTALMFFSVNVSFASLPVFLPTIINDMDFSALTSQALSAPPYLVAFVGVLVVGHYSDGVADSRGLFLIGAAATSSVSYLTIASAGFLTDRGILGRTPSIVVRYAAMYPAAFGLFSSVTLIITWTLNNQRSSTGKGTAMTILNLLGQCGPLVGVRLFPDSQGPEFVPGMLVCGSFMAGVALLAVGLRAYLRRLNQSIAVLVDGQPKEELELQERLMGEEQEDIDGPSDAGGFKMVDDTRPRVRFRYML